MKANKSDLVESAKRGDLTGLQAMVGSRDLKNKALALRALIGAAGAGKRSCVRFLLTYADAKGLAAEGKTALMAAASGGHTAVVELLMGHSHVQAKDRSGNTALTLAARKGHAECLHRLLPLSDVSHCNAAGHTALMLAAEAGSLACVQLLSDRAPAWMGDTKECSAAKLAASQGHWAIVDLLAPKSPLKHVQKIFEQVGADQMPQWAARFEREQLQQTLATIEDLPATEVSPGSLSRGARRL